MNPNVGFMGKTDRWDGFAGWIREFREFTDDPGEQDDRKGPKVTHYMTGVRSKILMIEYWYGF